jgi:hypothetical protein
MTTMTSAHQRPSGQALAHGTLLRSPLWAASSWWCEPRCGLKNDCRLCSFQEVKFELTALHEVHVSLNGVSFD